MLILSMSKIKTIKHAISNLQEKISKETNPEVKALLEKELNSLLKEEQEALLIFKNVRNRMLVTKK